jgi:hypothetical protein
MIGPVELTLVSSVAVLFMGLVLPLWAFFRLGAMRAMVRRRQSATPPTICLTTLVIVGLFNIAHGAVSMLTIYGVLVNALWLWVVKTRGRRPDTKE